MWFVGNDEFTNTDLNFYNCGEEKCPNGYSYGPAVRNHFIVHFIINGKGTFRCGKKQYNLQAGNAFLICPDYVTYYEADMEDPWHYIWVGFNGVKVPKIIRQTGLSYDNPILFYDIDDFFIDTIRQMASYTKYSFTTELSRIAYLYIFLAKLIEIAPLNPAIKPYNSSIEEYVKSAVDYIEKNYSHSINVNQLSDYIGINRRYLCTLFKKFTGQTPIDYIIKTRIEKACELLANDNLSIAEVSNSVGYSDQFIFSKQFKKSKGETPSSYRKNIVK
jgi:AraC-type DNA-binding domain-containing proteins